MSRTLVFWLLLLLSIVCHTSCEDAEEPSVDSSRPLCTAGSLICTLDTLQPTFGEASAAVGDVVYHHGGCRPLPNAVADHLYEGCRQLPEEPLEIRVMSASFLPAYQLTYTTSIASNSTLDEADLQLFGHSMAFFRSGVILFGGVRTGEAALSSVSNRIMSLDIISLEWTLLYDGVNGTYAPQARWGAEVAVMGTYLYVLGGLVRHPGGIVWGHQEIFPAEVENQHLYIFDLVKRQWLPPVGIPASLSVLPNSTVGLPTEAQFSSSNLPMYPYSAGVAMLPLGSSKLLLHFYDQLAVFDAASYAAGNAITISPLSTVDVGRPAGASQPLRPIRRPINQAPLQIRARFHVNDTDCFLQLMVLEQSWFSGFWLGLYIMPNCQAAVNSGVLQVEQRAVFFDTAPSSIYVLQQRSLPQECAWIGQNLLFEESGLPIPTTLLMSLVGTSQLGVASLYQQQDSSPYKPAVRSVCAVDLQDGTMRSMATLTSAGAAQQAWPYGALHSLVLPATAANPEPRTMVMMPVSSVSGANGSTLWGQLLWDLEANTLTDPCTGQTQPQATYSSTAAALRDLRLTECTTQGSWLSTPGAVTTHTSSAYLQVGNLVVFVLRIGAGLRLDVWDSTQPFQAAASHTFSTIPLDPHLQYNPPAIGLSYQDPGLPMLAVASSQLLLWGFHNSTLVTLTPNPSVDPSSHTFSLAVDAVIQGPQPPRSGPSLLFIPPGDVPSMPSSQGYVIMYGGRAVDGATLDVSPLSDMWLLDLSGRSWQLLVPAQPPSPRLEPGLALLGGRMYLFSGFQISSQGLLYDHALDLYSLDLDVPSVNDSTWRRETDVSELSNPTLGPLASSALSRETNEFGPTRPEMVAVPDFNSLVMRYRSTILMLPLRRAAPVMDGGAAVFTAPMLLIGDELRIARSIQLAAPITVRAPEVSIRGHPEAGQSQVAIDCNGIKKAIYLEVPATAAAVSQGVGAISDLLIGNCSLSAVNLVVEGVPAGAFLLPTASLRLERLILEGNMGGLGMGISLESSVQAWVEDSIFRNNAGSDSTDMSSVVSAGAGSRLIVMDNCTFIANNASAVSLFDPLAGTTAITNSIFEGGRGTGDGGAIHVQQLDAASATSSSSTSGQAGWSLQVEGCSFMDNHAARDGGALCFRSTAASLSVQRVVMAANHAERNGGAIHFSSAAGLFTLGVPVEIEDTVLDPNSTVLCSLMDNTAGVNGGAVWLGTIVSEVGDVEAVLTIGLQVRTIIANASFTGNVAINGSGGAIFQNWPGSLEVLGGDGEGVKLTGNRARNGLGGGVFVGEASDAVLQGVLLTSNTARVGAGVACDTCNSIVIDSCQVLDNTASDNGGGIAVRGAVAASAVVGSVVGGNQVINYMDATDAASGSGGGLFLQASAPFNLTGNNFTANSARLGGGAYLDASACSAAAAYSSSYCLVADGNTFVSNRLAASSSTEGAGAQVFLASTKGVKEPALVAAGAAVASLESFLEVVESGTNNQLTMLTNVASGRNISFDVLTLDVQGNPVLVQPSQQLYIRLAAEESQLIELQGSTVVELERPRTKVEGFIPSAFPGSYNVTLYITSSSSSLLRNGSLLLQIRQCFIGEYRRGRNCEDCVPLQYNFWPETALCRVCEDNGVCALGGFLTPEAGFWQSHPRSPQMHRCFARQACDYHGRAAALEGLQTRWRPAVQVPAVNVSEYMHTLCATGYRGHLCAVCDETAGQYGYGKNGLTCAPCPSRGSASTGTAWVMVGQACILALQVGLYLNSLRQVRQRAASIEADKEQQQSANETAMSSAHPAVERVDSIAVVPITATAAAEATVNDDPFNSPTARVQTVLKLLLDWVQMLGIIRAVRISWPDSLLNFLNTADVTSSSSGFLLYCSMPGAPLERTIARIIVALLIPFFFAAVGVAVWLLISSLVRAWRRQLPESLGTCLAATMVVVLLYFHPSTSQHIMSILAFIKLDDPGRWEREGGPLPVDLAANGTWWAEYTNERYFQGPHRPLLLAAGLPALLFYALGLPIAIVVVLTSNRRRLKDFSFRCKFGLLYDDYNDQCYWWQAAVLLRQLLLIGCVSYLRSLGAALQLLAALLVLIINHQLLAVLNPYAAASLVHVARWVLFTMVVTLTLLLYSVSAWVGSAQQTSVLVAVVVLNIITLVGLLVVMLWEVWKALQHKEMQKQLKVLKTAFSKASGWTRTMRSSRGSKSTGSKSGGAGLRDSMSVVPDFTQLAELQNAHTQPEPKDGKHMPAVPETLSV